jgi:hypothetical protein
LSAVDAGSTDTDAFHDLKYSKAELFRKVADCLSGQTIPDVGRVKELDGQLRQLKKTGLGSGRMWMEKG